MKYNKSEVMKKAWEIKRENTKNIFSICLKMAWEIVKNTVKKVVLKGTEKQINWANDIKQTVLNTLKEYREQLLLNDSYESSNSEHVKLINKFDINISAIESEPYASNIIDMFSNINKNDSLVERYKTFRVCLIVTGNSHVKNYIK